MDELIFRKVKTAADIRNLPRWVGRVDPQTVKLKRVIWPYHLPHEMPCSLTNCGTPHKDGVLIELEDGRISNIGHICGADANKFGDDFVRAKTAMSEEKVRAMILLALEDRQTLNSIRSRAAEVRKQRWTLGKSSAEVRSRVSDGLRGVEPSPGRSGRPHYL